MAFTNYSYGPALAALGQAFDNIGNGFAEQDRRRSLSDLGGQIDAGDYKGAARTAFASGDVNTGMAVLKLGQGYQDQALGQAAIQQLASIGNGSSASLSPLGSGAGASLPPTQPTSARAPSDSDLTPADMKAVPSFVQAAGQGVGIDPNYLGRTIGIESKWDPNAVSPTGAKGLGQFTKGTWKQYGAEFGSPTDPQANVAALANLSADNADGLAQALNREPTQGEVYLAHQQGLGGAKALLANPGANVVDALAPAYGGDRNAAAKAVLVNGGRPDMTAGQFSARWTSRYPNAPARITPDSSQIAPGPAMPATAQVVQPAAPQTPPPSDTAALFMPGQSGPSIGFVRQAAPAAPTSPDNPPAALTPAGGQAMTLPAPAQPQTSVSRIGSANPWLGGFAGNGGSPQAPTAANTSAPAASSPGAVAAQVTAGQGSTPQSMDGDFPVRMPDGKLWTAAQAAASNDPNSPYDIDVQEAQKAARAVATGQTASPASGQRSVTPVVSSSAYPTTAAQPSSPAQPSQQAGPSPDQARQMLSGMSGDTTKLLAIAANPRIPDTVRDVAKLMFTNVTNASKLPDTMREFLIARANGWTDAANPQQYAQQKQADPGLAIKQQVAARQAEIFNRGLDPSDPTNRRYILTGQLADEKTDEGDKITSQIKARQADAVARGLDANQPTVQQWIQTGRYPTGKDQPVTATVAARAAAAQDQGLQPGSPEAQRYALTGQLPDPAKAADMKATEQKLYAANVEKVNILQQQIQDLTKARQLNPQVYSGNYEPGAATWAARNLPFGLGNMVADPDRVTATTQYANLVNGATLSQGKELFGARPTNYDEKLLQALKANPNMTPQERDTILGQMILHRQQLLKETQDNTAAMKGGTFFRRGPQAQAVQGNPTSAQQAPPTRAQAPAQDSATIPDGAVQALRSDPRLAVQFDAKYGQGASASVLGGQ